MARDLTPTTSTNPQTLADALVAFGDPADVAEMIQLAKEGYDGPMVFYPAGQPSEYERKVFRYRELRERLETALIAQLRDGSLVAVGYDARAAIDAPPITIPAGRWRVLVPNFKDSSAADGGLTISGILVSSSNRAGAPTEASSPEPPPKLTPRLVIRRGWRTVALDGTTTRVLSEQSFSLLCLLTERVLKDEPFVTTRDIEDRIWGSFVHRVSRGARDVVRELRDALAVDASDPDAARQLIENSRSRGWRLTLAAAEIAIYP